ncbi:MAG: hypothetical protein QOJ84_4043 [Bradyrhizobium sp.]|nr:hypothetical protein [Bradyrhizobium sp.]
MPVGPLGFQGYPGSAPIYTPGQLNPALGSVIQNALDGLPEHVRRELHPGVDLDVVDTMMEEKLQQGFDKLQPIINGYGPGGSGYTDGAARKFQDGTLTPADHSCQVMGGKRLQGVC